MPGRDSSTLFDAARKGSPIRMPTIDLGGVPNASYLFHDLIISNETLRLKNTDALEYADGMFKNMKFSSPESEIVGLDTRNVRNAA